MTRKWAPPFYASQTHHETRKTEARRTNPPKK